MADMIRLQRSGGYTVLPNGILRDTNLSLKTKGLFAIILSLPEGWDYSVAGLATVAGCGRDAIRGALKEMETAGYLTRMRAHGEGGKFTGVVYTIRDVAAPLSENPTMDENAPLSGKPTTENPTSEKPSSGNPTQLNKYPSSKDLSNTPLPPTGGGVKAPKSKLRRKRAAKSEPTWRPDKFAGFWLAYPRDEGQGQGGGAVGCPARGPGADGAVRLGGCPAPRHRGWTQAAPGVRGLAGGQGHPLRLPLAAGPQVAGKAKDRPGFGLGQAPGGDVWLEITTPCMSRC